MTAPSPALLDPATLRPALAGASATLSGNGLARFAYVPLFPAMVATGWVTGAEAGLLGAFNLSGYLIGVLAGRGLAKRAGIPGALNVGMALAVASLAACAWHGGFAWLAAWRGVAGVAGGILMGLAGPAVQGAVATSRRGFAGGIALGGVAAGVVVSALAVPLLLTAGVAQTWLGLAAGVGLLWALSARAWPAGEIVVPDAPGRGAGLLYLGYSLSAAAFVPHMVYFSDLVVHGRHFPIEVGAWAWLFFGLGGLPGPLLIGRVADRWGAGAALRTSYLLQIVAISLVFLPGRFALIAAAALGGFSAIGISAAALARARELVGAASGAVWVRATAGFAVAQAATGFALAALFGRTESHDLVFAIGLALAAAALAVAFVPTAHRTPAA